MQSTFNATYHAKASKVRQLKVFGKTAGSTPYAVSYGLMLRLRLQRPVGSPQVGRGTEAGALHGTKASGMLLFVNSVNGFALLTHWANFVCLSSPSFDSVRNYFLFDFFPPDLLESPPPLDLTVIAHFLLNETQH